MIKEMLRFYAIHQDITVDQMSAASYKAWVACNTIVKALPTHEQDLIIDYFSVSADDKQSLMKWYENQRRLSPEYVNEIVRKVCRLVAIERGIADE